MHVKKTLCIVLLGLLWTSQTAFAAFSITVDNSIKGNPEYIPGKDQDLLVVDVIINPDGEAFQFVRNELIVCVRDNNFIEDYKKNNNAVVLHYGDYPDPPSNFPDSTRSIPRLFGYYRVRIDPSTINTQNINQYAFEMGLDGQYKCSSNSALALFTFLLGEWSAGIMVADANMVYQVTDCVPYSWQEYPTDPSAPNPSLANDGFFDPFTDPFFSDMELKLTYTWQLVEAFGLPGNSVPVYVIDNGFAANDDFRSFVGYDFVHEDYDPTSSAWDYHGIRSMSMCAALPDNQFGSVGTGGQVARPYAFRFGTNNFEAALAIRTATAWGAHVVNMSFGGNCNWWCRNFSLLSGRNAIDEAIAEAIDHGVLLFASAGNDENDLGDHVYLPAEGGSGDRRPLVVGAIDFTTYDAVRNSVNGWGSNYGTRIGIWAPGAPRNQITTTPHPLSPTFSHFNGTSCASPYVAGVGALLKAIIPTIDQELARTLIQDNANHAASSDARVGAGIIDPFWTVEEATRHEDAVHPAPDISEPSTEDDPYLLTESGEYCGNLCETDLNDYYMLSLFDYMRISLNAERSVLLTNFFSPFYTYPEMTHDHVIPFDETLLPGYYLIRLFINNGISYYDMDLDIVGPAVLAPDRFEANNTHADAAHIIYPGNRMGDELLVEDLNFHVSGDLDYFRLQLPDLPEDMFGYEENLSVTIETDPDSGRYGSFYTEIFYPDSTSEPHYRAFELENVHEEFPGGQVVFYVADRGDNRNYYRMRIQYEYHRRGVFIPETITYFEIPDWIEAMTDMHIMDAPPSALDGLPLDLPFPFDPWTMKEIAEGNAPASMPPNVMLLRWADKSPFGCRFNYAGSSDDFEFTLIDALGDVVSQSEEFIPVSDNIRTDNQTTIHKKMTVDSLEQGYYGIKIEGNVYPHVLSFEMDPVEFTTDIVDAGPSIPSRNRLYQNFPNPFNPVTTIQYDLSRALPVKIEIFNIRGELIKTLVDENQNAGTHFAKWDGKNRFGKISPSGMYFYKLTTLNESSIHKMLLLH